jgi:hypothetical protein
MTWLEALALVITRTGHERFRWLCAEENPNAAQREGYRGMVMRLAAARDEDEQLRAYVARHGCGGCGG